MRKFDKLRDVCRKFFAAFVCAIDSYAKEFLGHLKSGNDPVSGKLVGNARNMNNEDVKQYVKRYVLDWIATDKRETIARTIKGLREDDTDMLSSTIVEYV